VVTDDSFVIEMIHTNFLDLSPYILGSKFFRPMETLNCASRGRGRGVCLLCPDLTLDNTVAMHVGRGMTGKERGNNSEVNLSRCPLLRCSVLVAFIC
jgi:hypothetical protein